MSNKDLDKLMELIDSVKMHSGCEKVTLIGNKQLFDELITLGFPLGDFVCKEVADELDESKLYIIPVEL